MKNRLTPELKKKLFYLIARLSGKSESTAVKKFGRFFIDFNMKRSPQTTDMTSVLIVASRFSC